jgi:hypothetical protein
VSSALATIVEWRAVWQTIVAAIVSGLGVTFAFSLAVLGATRSIDLSRDGRGGAALAAALLGVAALGVCVAAAVLGIIVMTTK